MKFRYGWKYLAEIHKCDGFDAAKAQNTISFRKDKLRRVHKIHIRKAIFESQVSALFA
jgi:hypothetical protein